MLKTLGFIFILFIGISLIIIASFFNGIEINHISYKNVNIKKLYLKYDKKLNINLSNLSITDQNSQEIVSLSASFNAKYQNGFFELDTQELLINNTNVQFSGLIYINKNQISLNNDSSIVAEIHNFTHQFDTKMEKVTAEKVFMTYSNNVLDFTFEKPYYGDILIENSKVSYVPNTDTLKLYLKTKSLFNDTLKKALFRYGVKVNTIQYDGKNEISINIFIPFNHGKLFVESDIFIQDANIEDFGIKYKVNSSKLHYKNKIITGTIDLNHLTYQGFNVNNSVANYNINFNNGFNFTANSDTLHFSKDGNHYSLKDALLQKNLNIINFSSKINDSNNTLKIDLQNQTDLNTKKISGKFVLKYDNLDQNISLKSDALLYTGDFKNNLTMQIDSDDINITKPLQSNIKNLSIRIEDKKMNTNFLLEDIQKTHSLNIFNTTDINNKKSYGTIDVKNIHYKNILHLENKNIPYFGSYKDNLTLDSYGLGLHYFYEYKTKTQKIKVSHPGKLLKIFPFINVENKEKGSLYIQTDNYFKNTFVEIDNLNINIDSSYLKNKDINTTKSIQIPTFPIIDLIYNKSKIKYDNFTLPFDTLKLTTNNNIATLNIKKDNSIINLKTKDNSVIFNATKLSDKYINTFLNKEILKDGYMNLNIYGEDINLLSGDVNFHKTTIKNVTVINSLLTFVNTTPAIINPLLALPTLFRLAQTGFDTNGYYLKYGDGSFRFNIPKQELDLYDLYTNGKMSNFIVNSHNNLKTKKIDANVEISFLKDFTKAIRYIPVVGYIIMGEDGEFHTNVLIHGTTDDPILETNTISEATNGITGILNRIFTLPLEPFREKNAE